MSSMNELKEVLEHTQTAQFVTTMLRDISATKLQSIRAQFDANHAYFIELHELMALVEAHMGEEKILSKKMSTPSRVYVALTSNKRFYGTLNKDVIHRLRERVAGDPRASVVVLGQTGKQLLEAGDPVTATFEQFASDEPTENEVFASVAALSGFDEIIVIHPTFINAFEQKSAETDITHVPLPSELKEHPPLEYLFEPELEKLIEFFRTQVRLVLFSRVLLETRLALTGARLMKMQHAREQAGELLKQQRLVIHKEERTIGSMRLLETFAGFRSKNEL
jgi:ATP synthase F1 gamma subunit